MDIGRIICTNARCTSFWPRGTANRPPLCRPLRDHAPFFTAQASLFALTQCLPGPSSTQLATALGGLQAGLPGAIAAFVCFDLPGFVVLATSGITLRMYKDAEFDEGLMGVLATMQKGLGAASVGLLCHAALTIVQKCAPDPLTKKLALLSAVAATLINSALLFPILLLIGGLATRAAAKPAPSGQGGGSTPADSEAGGDKAALLSSQKASVQKGLSKPLGVSLFLAWALLLLALWMWADLPGAPRMARRPTFHTAHAGLQAPRTQPTSAARPVCNRHASSLQPCVRRCASRAPSSAPARSCGAAARSSSRCCYASSCTLSPQSIGSPRPTSSVASA